MFLAGNSFVADPNDCPAAILHTGVVIAGIGGLDKVQHDKVKSFEDGVISGHQPSVTRQHK